MNSGTADIQTTLRRWLLHGVGRAQGFDRDSLRRVERYLNASPRAYTHALQTPRDYFPGLTAQPWHDPAQFAWVSTLEHGYRWIKDELRAIPSHFRRQHQGLADAGDWQVYYFSYLGQRAVENCARCPRTAAIIDSIPVTNTGHVYFSALAPHTHIAPHCGPTNARLRCHLGVEVPSGCRIRVGAETRTWQEGQCLIFDDSFEHEVWHSGDSPRIVLVLDIWHPDLTAAEVWAMSQIMRVSTRARKVRRLVMKKPSAMD